MPWSSTWLRKKRPVTRFPIRRPCRSGNATTTVSISSASIRRLSSSTSGCAGVGATHETSGRALQFPMLTRSSEEHRMPENTLPYPINDADNHFNEPDDCFERYIDPSKIDLAIRSVRSPEGKRMQLFAGQPSKFHSDQVTFSKEELEKMLGDTSKVGTGRGTVPHEEGQPDLGVVPGMLLNRLNPLKGLSDEERQAFVSEFRNKSEAFGDR